MKHFAMLALGAACLAPVAGFAGGMAAPMAEPMIVAEVITVVPNGDWTGFYGGAALGYADVGSTEDVLNGSGFLGGVLAGYRMDWGQWVGGVEADYDWSGIDLGEGDLGSLDAVGRLKLQVGYDMGRTLVYGTGGWAYGDATVAGASLSDWGWVAGVGVDYMVNEAWLVGAEVLYHDFSNFDDTGIDLNATTIKARVAYRF